MKTYLLSIPDSIKGFKDQINVKAALCGRIWRVFNSDGDKIVLIFQKDGKIIISQNGEAIKSSWEYIKANKSILIEHDSKMLLLHPTFVDDVLFILQQDGMENYIIMIDDSKIERLISLTIEAITRYLNKVSGVSEERQSQENERKQVLAKRQLIYKEHINEIEEATAKYKEKKKRNIFTCSILSGLLLISALFSGINYIIVGSLIVLAIFLVILISIDTNLETKIASTEKSIIDKYL